MSSHFVRSLASLSLLAAVTLKAQVPSTPSSANSTPAVSTAEQQTRVEQTTPPPAPPGPPLTLGDCIALAMKKNFDIQVQGYTVEQAHDALVVAESNFDPNLFVSAQRSVSQVASSTNLLDGTTMVGPRNDNTSFQVGANKRLSQTNGVLSISANASRSETNSSYALLNPVFGNGVSVSLNQPLLRNAGATVAGAQVKRNKFGVTIAMLGYKSRVLTVIRDTEDAYYNLVAARETLRIRRLSLQLAEALLSENQARQTSGVATELDVASAQVGVASARQAVVQADQAVRDAEDSLLSLINVGNLDVRPGPVSFQDYTGTPPAFSEAYKLARDYYPDTLSQADLIRQLGIDLAVAKRNTLPSLNLTAALGYTARATDESYWRAIDNLPREHGNNWSLGLTYSIPWGRRADRASYRSTLASLNAEKTRLDQLETQLLVDVRGAVRAVNTNLVSVQIAQDSTRFASQQYDLQKSRYDVGLSTSRLVLQAQDDLETAREKELAAKATLWIALAELDRLEGTSIERYHVQLPQAPKG